MRYILSLDQGTTSSRAIVFDAGGSIVSVAQKPFRQIFPKPGWVEHDAGEIWSSQAGVIAEALASAQVRAGDIEGIGIANQRETTVVWDRKTGQPICHAIVWQDRRTAGHCDRLKADGLEGTFLAKTGLVLDAYFSGTKIAWILDNIDGARQRAERGELAFGTVDSWLAYKLTGGKLHITDASNASRTLLFNIHTGDWDGELLDILNIPRAVLPEVRPSSAVYGEVTASPELNGVPICAMVGDQQAAMMGQVCTEPGLAKNTYGTGCFLLMNTGDKAITSKNKLLTTVAWRRDNRTTYALEGSVFVGGAIVQWLRDGLKIIRSASEVEALAASVPDSDGVYFVPALTGLGAPDWDPYARGTILGITRGTTSAHIARAALEGITFQVADLVSAMASDCGEGLKELRVDGGAAGNDLLMQIQADILQTPVVRPTVLETTALGAAYLAGLATGYYKSIDDVRSHRRAERTFEPSMSSDCAGALRARWRQAVGRAGGWGLDTGG
jgi:glycerol kinase